ncbi:MAG: VanZ family protein [Oscillospiraceae bacterium]|nr:VanZ family protein [Oscillospiraceae bacterium]
MKSKIVQISMRICFVIYLLALLYLLFFKRITVLNPLIEDIKYYGFWRCIKSWINLVPFRTISNYIECMDPISIYSIFYDYAFQNLAGNVLLFVPFGVCLPYFLPGLRKFSKFFITSLLTILCVELLQLITLLGACDIDDLLLNLPGCCIGFVIFQLIKPILLPELQKNN